jgi:predicted amidohydrolase
MWENAYYIGGHDDGIIDTPIGPVGAAVCWELVRTRTVRRLRDRVRLVVGGSCWWTMPEWPLPRALLVPRDEQNREIMRQTPARFARLVGAPVIHAAHCGQFVGETPRVPFLSYRSHYLGEAQIIAADGTLLGRRTYEEGEGIVMANITVAEPQGIDPVPERFWIPDLPQWAIAVWNYQNAHGARQYRRVKAQGAFNWQQPGWERLDPAPARVGA